MHSRGATVYNPYLLWESENIILGTSRRQASEKAGNVSALKMQLPGAFALDHIRTTCRRLCLPSSPRFFKSGAYFIMNLGDICKENPPWWSCDLHLSLVSAFRTVCICRQDRLARHHPTGREHRTCRNIELFRDCSSKLTLASAIRAALNAYLASFIANVSKGVESEYAQGLARQVAESQRYKKGSTRSSASWLPASQESSSAAVASAAAASASATS